MDLFKLFLLRKGLRQSSVKLIVNNLNRVPDLGNTDTHILNLLEQGRKATYINSIILAIRQYGEFVKDEKLKSIPLLKTQESIKSIMSIAEINDFLAIPAPSSEKKKLTFQMMSMFWKVLCYSGARAGEIASLTVDSVDLGQGVLMVDGKTGKRNVPINPVLLEPLTIYIKSLTGNLLFESPRVKRPIEKSAWCLDFHRRCQVLGIKRQNLTPHSLRHSFISRLLDEDISLKKVQQIVGHKQITTTDKYYHLSSKKVIEAIAKDPLSRGSQGFDERFKQLREGLRKLLGDYCLTADEEKRMLALLTA